VVGVGAAEGAGVKQLMVGVHGHCGYVQSTRRWQRHCRLPWSSRFFPPGWGHGRVHTVQVFLSWQDLKEDVNFLTRSKQDLRFPFLNGDIQYH
jgi:hypothetical protein